jgi:hypothetical protein
MNIYMKRISDGFEGEILDTTPDEATILETKISGETQPLVVWYAVKE